METRLDHNFLTLHHGSLINDGRRFTGKLPEANPPTPYDGLTEHERRIKAARIASAAGAVQMASIATTTLPRRPRRRQQNEIAPLVWILAAALVVVAIGWTV